MAHGRDLHPKTDKADARWLANLMRAGLLQAGLIPPQGPRDLRDLTRYRTQLVQERRRAVNRVPGGLARANSKLAAVATAMMGGSGRAVLSALLEGRAEAAVTAELAQGRPRPTMPWLEQALTVLTHDHHRRLLALQLAHIDCDEQIDTLNADITRGLMALGPREPLAPAAEVREAGGNAGAPDTSTSPRPTQMAHAAARTQGTSLSALYQRLAAR